MTSLILWVVLGVCSQGDPATPVTSYEIFDTYEAASASVNVEGSIGQGCTKQIFKATLEQPQEEPKPEVTPEGQ